MMGIFLKFCGFDAIRGGLKDLGLMAFVLNLRRFASAGNQNPGISTMPFVLNLRRFSTSSGDYDGIDKIPFAWNLRRFASAGLVLLLIVLMNGCGRADLPPQDATYDLLILNGRIVDGSGMPAYNGSVLVSNGMVVYAGEADLSRYSATTRIDAAGRVVSPGFIDAHAHGNAELNPVFRNFWSMGVTSIALGMDGSSAGIESLYDWMERVEEARPGVNIIPFTGHGTARTHAGLPMEFDAATETDLARLTDIIEAQMRDGAFGVSKGIEYIPGRFAGREELAVVARTVSGFDGLIMSHVRNEDDEAVASSVRELLTMGSDGGARVHVSHIKIVYANDKSDAEYVLAVMDSARAAGLDVTADVYPYTASYTGIGILYPEWALPPNDFDGVRRERRAELATYLRDRVNRRNGPEATLMGTRPWSGRTLGEIADSLGMPFEDVLIDFMPPGSASAAYFVMNMDVMRRFLMDPYVMVSSDGSPTMMHPRGYGSFARIIRQFVVEEGTVGLEEAVYKMSGQTAEVLRLNCSRGSDGDLRLAPRGLLRAGFAADVLVFDPLRVRDTASFEDPHQFAFGFDYVVVNGVLVQAEGEPTGNRPGVALRMRGGD
jgi:N-acyl-D-aspartate/D-glutamate deacylase